MLGQLTKDYTPEDWFDGAMRVFLCLMALMLPYSMAVIEWAFGLTFVAMLSKRIYLLRKKKLQWSNFLLPKKNPLNWPILIYLCFCFVSVFMSDRFADSFESLFTKTAEPILMYFLFLEAFRTVRQLNVLFIVIFMTAVVTGIDAMIQFHITGEDLFLSRPLSKGPRATAGFNAPNGLGAYLVMTIPIVASLWFHDSWKSTKMRATVLGGLAILVYALILSFSRGAWISLVAGSIIAVLWGMCLKQINKRQILAFLVGSSLLVGLMGTYYLNNKDKITSLNRSVLNWRLDVWSETVEMIKERPLFGYGINTYMRKFQEYKYDRRNIPMHKRHNATYAHNCYLQIGMESGILGLMGFIAILIAYYRHVVIQIKKLNQVHPQYLSLAIGLLGGITAFLIHAFFDTHFYSLPLAAYLWTMMAALIIILNQVSNGKEHHV